MINQNTIPILVGTGIPTGFVIGVLAIRKDK